MATSFKATKTNVAVTAATPKQGTWGSATTLASATTLENIKTIRGSLTATHKGGFVYNAATTWLAVVVDAWISGAWQPVYTTGVEGAPTAAVVGAPVALEANGSRVVEIPPINLGGSTANGKRYRFLVFGPGSGNFDVEGELHGSPT